MVDWYVEGKEFGNCSCIWACPCQFEALPTHGSCRGFEVVHIDRGHFADIRLDGLRLALTYAWPGPIFEGNGEMQAIIDERADERQREALIKIVCGEETQDGATHWWVFRAMCAKVHEPLFKPIHYDVYIDARTARVSIPGVLESVGTPIKSPATGEAHRVRIDLPHGIEFDIAEIGNATTQATGAIQLDLKDTYGQFNILRHSGKGAVHV